MPHEECVNLIKRAGDTLALKVITANPIPIVHSHYQHIESHFHQQQVASQSLPHRRKGNETISFVSKRRKALFFSFLFFSLSTTSTRP